jgi:hypothetical protein
MKFWVGVTDRSWFDQLSARRPDVKDDCFPDSTAATVAPVATHPGRSGTYAE